MAQDFQHRLHLGEHLDLVPRMQEYFKSFVSQLLSVFLAVADFLQGDGTTHACAAH